MTRISRNITANLVGNLWSVALAVAVVPLVLNYLGAEAYGLVGFFTSLTALLSLLDLGLGASVTREMARLSVEEDAEQTRTTVRTFEVFYWGVGAVAAVIVFLMAPFVAEHWLKGRSLSAASIYYALLSMGLVVALQWPMSLYLNVLMGRQQQVVANQVQVLCSTLRSLGVLVVLANVSATVTAYFLWQAAAYLIQTGILAREAYRALPRGVSRPRVRWDVLRAPWRFSTQMMVGYALAAVCVQLDRVLIGKMFTLDVLGYYSLAQSLTTLLPAFVTPVFSALFPRFTQLVTRPDRHDTVRAFHDGAQLVSVIALPIAIVGVLFPGEILVAWTGNPLVAQQSGTILSLLFAGAGLNSLMTVPYAMILARGDARLYVRANLIIAVILVPLLFLLCQRFGPPGAALGGIAYNCGFVLLVANRIFTGHLDGERPRWYLQDMAAPVTLAGLVAICLRSSVQVPGSRWSALGLLVVVTAAGFGAALVAAPRTRSHLSRLWNEQLRNGP